MSRRRRQQLDFIPQFEPDSGMGIPLYGGGGALAQHESKRRKGKGGRTPSGAGVLGPSPVDIGEPKIYTLLEGNMGVKAPVDILEPDYMQRYTDGSYPTREGDGGGGGGGGDIPGYEFDIGTDYAEVDKWPWWMFVGVGAGVYLLWDKMKKGGK